MNCTQGPPAIAGSDVLLAVGTQAPTFRLPAGDGEPRTLEQLGSPLGAVRPFVAAATFLLLGASHAESASAANLELQKPGTGQGTVTSSPAGINCGTTCSGSSTWSPTH